MIILLATQNNIKHMPIELAINLLQQFIIDQISSQNQSK